MPESIRTTWPDATVQTCVVHMVRNSLRYASKADWSKITKQMRAIYTAPTLAAAEAEFVPFLEFPADLRRVVYTTNAIESLNARFLRAVRHRGHFPTEQAAMNVLYLVATTRKKNRENMTGRIQGWKSILNTLTVHYGDRIADHIR